MITLAIVLTVISMLPTANAQAPGPPSVDPCTLIPRTDVERVMGPFARPPRSETNEQARMCEYAFKDGNLSLELWVFPASGLDRARARFKDVTEITDLGAVAFHRRDKAIGWLELYTRKGNVTVEVTMKSMAGDVEKAKALARKALGSL